MDDSILEKKLREALRRKSEEVLSDARTEQRIRTKVYEAIEEERNMKHRNWKRTAVVAAAICVLGSITAVALGKPAYFVGHSSINEVVRDYEEAAAMQKQYDAAVKAPERFSNGYEFKEAVPQYQSSKDADGNTLETGTSMNFIYAKDGAEDVTLFNDRLSRAGDTGAADETLVLGDGTVLSFTKLVNKFVPPDYTPTEEELKLCEEGKLNIGYGSDTIQVKTSVHVNWTQDDVNYSLFSFSDRMTAEEFLQMAQEIAESGEEE